MKKLLSLLLLFLLVACAAPQARFDADYDAATSAERGDLVFYAMSLIDTPYRFGGKGEEVGFDCSGFVGHVFRHELNIALPRTSREISQVGTPLHPSELRPGDLVFYNTLGRPFSHVGIYIGENKFVHSPKSGDRVRVEKMEYRYWQTRYNGARRIY